MSNPNPPGPSIPAPRWFTWVALAALAGYAVFVFLNMAIAAGGSDSSGYLNSAKLFADGRTRTELRLPAEIAALPEVARNVFTPLGFQPVGDKTKISPTYPTGLPLQFALAGKIMGWQSGPAVFIAGCACLTVWLCYRIGRQLGLTYELAAAGAAILGACPVFLFSSFQALSDMPAALWCLLSLYCALRAREAANWAAACGLAYSMAVLVRPTNLLFAPALLIVLGLHPGRLARFVAAGIPAAGWLAWYNNYQYGGPFDSGYGPILTAFELHYGWPTLVHFSKWLAIVLPAAVLLLPFCALAHPATRERGFLALAVAFVAIGGLYLFYNISHEVWWCLRFILPVLPALILMAMLGTEAVARGPGARWPRGFRPLAAGVLAGWAIGMSAYWSPVLHVHMIKRYESVYAEASLAAQRTFSTDTLVATSAFSGAMYFYTAMPIVRSDLVEAADFARYIAPARASKRPVGAVVFDFEEAQLFARCPGTWKKIGSHANVNFWLRE